MDQERFDDLARLLGAAGTRRAGLRAALGGLLGVGIGAAALDAEAHGKATGRGRAGAAKRRHECGPDAPCPTGFDCVKQGRKRRCACPTGVVCDGACCPAGQVCQDGACTVPATCIAPGEPCKGVGAPCCDGRTCASGQGGRDDVACYVHKTGACQSTADCVYGTACLDGRCGFDVPPPAATGASCNPDVGQQCADPAATCTRYDRPGAPAGSYCSLPLDYTCTGDPDCTCYRCGWTLEGISPASRRDGRDVVVDTPRLACCGPVGYACTSDRNCCLGATCVNGACAAVCDVCASGCPYTTIRAAFDAMPAGSVVRIAPGVYGGIENRVETFTNTAKDMTFVRCGDEGAVTWLRPRTAKLWQSQYNFNPGETVVAFVDLEFSYPPDESAREDLLGLGSRDSGANRFSFLGCRFVGNGLGQKRAIDASTRSAVTLVGCTFEGLDAQGESGTALHLESIFDAVIERCTFRDNQNTNYGGAIYKGNTGTLRIVDSLFEGNRSQEGGAIRLVKGSLVLENVAIRGNSAQDQGGGIYVVNNSATLSALGSTSVTGNTIFGDLSAERRTGSGIFCNQGDGVPCASFIGGTTAANVTANTPADKQCAVKTPDTFYAVDCGTWCLPAGAAIVDPARDCRVCCSGACSGSVCA